ncbi:hypothetical protein BJ978_000814 [Agromyces terreus]|uniref:Uncharacterized protein n=1 Tax=Agromyces terreus TaxID=424795 RepID=A0A9X2GZC2_9MICO|nr:hypothetical protein [Agromyces terreus]MCP2370138.1 hypothetical protein [Agromyces terreus]
MRAARATLIVLGLAGLATGSFVLLTDVAPPQYPGVVLWVLGAIVVHDGVIAPLAVAVGLGAARAKGVIGGRGIAVAQAALLVGAVLTVIAVPAIVASAIGPRNPTVLVGTYALSLAVAWALVLVTAGVALAVGASTTGRSPRGARGRAAQPAEPGADARTN